MKELVSPKQVAQAIGVGESSVKRWCDDGKILSIRTGGGHRRLPINGVLTFLRTAGYPIIAPEILGLPPTTLGCAARKLCEEREQLITSLIAGDEAVCREVVLNLYLAGHSVSVLCDEVLATAFHQIGEQWGCGTTSVYQERRACDICQKLLYELRRASPELPAIAPIAVGGTIDGDPYTLASSMVELVLRDLGWRASSLGNMLPFASIQQAMCDTHPQLFWLSVSNIRNQDRFLEEFARVSEFAAQQNVSLVVGGCALTEDVRKQMRYSAFCNSFKHLEAFAIERRLTIEKATQ